MQLTSKVTQQFKKVPLIDYLVARFSYLPREEWLERIAEERLHYQGVLASAETIVTQGGIVTYDVPPFPQPDANFDYSIVYEDDFLIGINKPSNLRVHGEGRFMMANLTYHLRNVHEPPYPDAFLINRLDADTSGVVLFAKDKDTAREMGWLFERKEVEKEYLALVHNIPEPRTGIIDTPIGKVENPKYSKVGRVPRSWANAPKVKDAVTGYAVEEEFRNPYTVIGAPTTDYGIRYTEHVSLVTLHPKTGRTHQLRVHMALLGCPIVGDRLYVLDDGAYVDWRENRGDPRYADLLDRQALHCAMTAFVHPMTGERVEVRAGVSADFATLLTQLRSG